MNGWGGKLMNTAIGSYRLRYRTGGTLSELLQYIARIALIIAILLAFSVAVYLVGKLRGKK